VPLPEDKDNSASAGAISGLHSCAGGKLCSPRQQAVALIEEYGQQQQQLQQQQMQQMQHMHFQLPQDQLYLAPVFAEAAAIGADPSSVVPAPVDGTRWPTPPPMPGSPRTPERVFDVDMKSPPASVARTPPRNMWVPETPSPERFYHGSQMLPPPPPMSMAQAAAYHDFMWQRGWTMDTA
jgi:hypothetical protein